MVRRIAGQVKSIATIAALPIEYLLRLSVLSPPAEPQPIFVSQEEFVRSLFERFFAQACTNFHSILPK
jgi:hypothetical protein